jgi:hypothetical protein
MASHSPDHARDNERWTNQNVWLEILQAVAPIGDLDSGWTKAERVASLGANIFATYS